MQLCKNLRKKQRTVLKQEGLTEFVNAQYSVATITRFSSKYGGEKQSSDDDGTCCEKHVAVITVFSGDFLPCLCNGTASCDEG